MPRYEADARLAGERGLVRVDDGFEVAELIVDRRRDCAYCWAKRLAPSVCAHSSSLGGGLRDISKVTARRFVVATYSAFAARAIPIGRARARRR